MRRFSGVGGLLYALGERLSFSDVPLSSEDGWDWLAPLDLSYWLPEALEFRACINGEWSRFDPVEVFYATGRVGFPRNLAHSTVLASGFCLPCSQICESETWELSMETALSEQNTFGGGYAESVLGYSARLTGVEVPITQVLCRFPTSGGGMFTGVGETTQVGPDVTIQFDSKGVRYDLR